MGYWGSCGKERKTRDVKRCLKVFFKEREESDRWGDRYTEGKLVKERDNQEILSNVKKEKLKDKHKMKGWILER